MTHINETPLRKELPELPLRMRLLPVDARGYPIPWFVGYVEGVPDFRTIRMGGREMAVIGNRCWLCGKPMGRYAAFVIGPMCAVNRVSSEPPSHLGCAEFAVKACPFLVRPHAKRRETGMPEEAEPAPGVMISRNPGVALVWVSRDWRPFRINEAGEWLINVGTPSSVSWWCQGRPATRLEVEESVESGCPALKAEADKQGIPPEQTERQLVEARELLPEA